METADAARSFEDSFDRVRVQADAADVLWPFDEQAARSFLRRAWEVTTAPGVINAFKWEGDTDDNAIENVLRARRLVIARASKHDARLADVYMKGLMQGLDASEGVERATSGEDDSQNVRPLWRTPSPENLQRLQTAYALIEEGAYEAAATLAAPALNEGVSTYLVGFIVSLHAHAPREGDALYLRLLEMARRDPRTNANDVLTLSRPIVSPDLQIYIGSDGSAHVQSLRYADEEMRRAFENAPEVRRAFYATAATVLLRPPLQSADVTQAGADSSALYFAVGRLLPFFEREAAQYAPALHARMSALAAEVGASRAQSLGANMGTTSLAPKNPVDVLAGQLEALARATDAGERDRMRRSIVKNAARHLLWDRAQSVAAQIEDAQARREALGIIATHQVMNIGRAYDDEPDKFERAAEFVRAADVSPEFHAAGLGQAAELAARAGKNERRDALLEEALTFANQAAKEDGSNLMAFALVGRSAARSNSERIWDVLPALVRGANESEETLVADTLLAINYGNPDDAQTSDESLDFADVFSHAARRDFRRAVAEVRSLGDEVTRATVTVAVARAALEKNSKSVGDKAR